MYELVAIGTKKKVECIGRDSDKNKLVKRAQRAFNKFIIDCQNCKSHYRKFIYGNGYYEVSGITENDKPFYQTWTIFEVPDDANWRDIHTVTVGDITGMLSDIIIALSKDTKLTKEEVHFIRVILNNISHATYL